MFLERHSRLMFGIVPSYKAPSLESFAVWLGKRHGSLLPVYFQGQMSSDFSQDLICTCKGKAVCSSGCVCFEQGLSCTDICLCQASEICRNSNTQMSRNKSIDDDDVDLLQLDVQE